MKRRNALTISMLALALSVSLVPGCVQGPVPLLTQVQRKGTLTVTLTGDFSQLRSAQARIADLSTVSISVDATGYSKTLALGQAQLANGGSAASASFEGIPPGRATVVATALDASSTTLASANGAADFTGSETLSVDLTLQLPPTYVEPSPKPRPTPSPTPSPSPSPLPSGGSIAANLTILDGPTIVAAKVSSVTGAIFGYQDGVGPYDVVIDAASNLLVSDFQNHRILKITPSGEVTTLAGSGIAGFADGRGSEAQFTLPAGLALDSSGNLFVADLGNNRIRKVTPAGDVTTVAGDGTQGYANGTGTSAKFKGLSGIAVTANGTLYVTDTGNNRIRKVGPGGEVSTLAGSGDASFLDASGLSARFNAPRGITLAPDGNLYVADRENHCIRKVTTAGDVTTLAGSLGAGYQDGSGTDSRFSGPFGITADGAGNLYVADFTRVRKVSQAGEVTTVAGDGLSDYRDGFGPLARFSNPFGIAADEVGDLYVVDSNRIRKIVVP